MDDDPGGTWYRVVADAAPRDHIVQAASMNLEDVFDKLGGTVGPDEAQVLKRRLLSDYRQPFDMPRAQALLLALRQVVPTIADPVLQRSRNLYTALGASR